MSHPLRSNAPIRVVSFARAQVPFISHGLQERDGFLNCKRKGIVTKSKFGFIKLYMTFFKKNNQKHHFPFLEVGVAPVVTAGLCSGQRQAPRACRGWHGH